MNNNSQRITHGKIKHWNDQKSFGFIESLDLSGEGIFVHISSMFDEHNPPKVGQLVSYNLSKDKLGRTSATNIKRLNLELRKSKTSLLLLVLMFLGVAPSAAYLE